MDVREIIKKAREQAKTPDELMLPDCFEEYLDLLELKKGATREERAILEPRLKKSLDSLKDVAERLSLSYGMDPSRLMEFFSNPANVDPKIGESLQGLSEEAELTASSQKIPKRRNKNLRV